MSTWEPEPSIAEPSISSSSSCLLVWCTWCSHCRTSPSSLENRHLIKTSYKLANYTRLVCILQPRWCWDKFPIPFWYYSELKLSSSCFEGKFSPHASWQNKVEKNCWNLLSPSHLSTPHLDLDFWRADSSCWMNNIITSLVCRLPQDPGTSPRSWSPAPTPDSASGSLKAVSLPPAHRKTVSEASSARYLTWAGPRASDILLELLHFRILIMDHRARPQVLDWHQIRFCNPCGIREHYAGEQAQGGQAQEDPDC